MKKIVRRKYFKLSGSFVNENYIGLFVEEMVEVDFEDVVVVEFMVVVEDEVDLWRRDI